jgi:hypothetical protein
VLGFQLRSADALNVSLLGRRDWIRNQGRTNAALLLVARAMNAEFGEPPDETHYAGVQGRTRGCSFELRVTTPRGERNPALVLTVRHYHTQATWHLEGPGLQPPELEPAEVQDAIERACHSFASQS